MPNNRRALFAAKLANFGLPRNEFPRGGLDFLAAETGRDPLTIRCSEGGASFQPGSFRLVGRAPHADPQAGELALPSAHLLRWIMPHANTAIGAGNPRRGMHYFPMWKWLLALLLFATPALAQQRPTAYEALRTVGTQLNRDFVNRVIALSGTNGDPQPETWKILIEDQQARGGVREVEVGNGRIISERTPLRSSVEGSLGAVIDTAKLNLDSSGAFTLAQQTADKSHVTFATADYTLRVDDRGNPIWMVALQRQSGEPAGRIFIGANHGTVTRTEGLFVGGDQAAIVDNQNAEPDSDYVEDEDDDEDEADQNIVKRQIKRAFRQARDDVKRTFYKVRRSFVDFFEDK